MYCDEGVYCIVRGIQLMRPKEFQTLVPCLGTFHMIKTVLRCIGKYLEESGADLTWLEARVFVPSVIETSVLKGGHYSRYLEGMRLLAEAFSRLMYKEFFTERGIAPYAPQLGILKNLKAATMEKSTEDSKMYIAKFSETSKAMVEDINNFIKTRSSSNENFNYWTKFLQMMATVNDLLRTDREGIWELHLDAVQRALYIFAAFDATNYLRWASLYIEDMRQLPKTAPSMYKNFSNGNFSIQDKPGRFIAVGGDQKLEQTINLSSKCSDGIIGHAKQKQYVAQWDLIYHEMMGVKNLHHQYTGIKERTHEAYEHHELTQATTNRKEAHIQDMMRFIEEKGSPLAVGASPKLQNFVTKEVMTESITNDMINAFEKGKEKYLMFRKERLLEKTLRFSSTIHRADLKTMKSIRDKPEKTLKKTVKEMNIAERNIEIARERGLTTEDLLKYDVVPSPVLFNAEGLMTKPEKESLIKRIRN